MNSPEATFTAGAIVATIWKNQKVFNGRQTIFNTVSLERRYMKDGSWQTTTNFRTADLPKANLVLNKAYEYLLTNPSAKEEAVS